jgi:ribulose-phosphate 3-epimerase
MHHKLLIAPSLLAAPHTTAKEVQAAVIIAEKGKADLLHIDVMDGIFVPQKTIWNNPLEIQQIRTELALDVHIMIQNPDERYESFIKAGAAMLTFHLEAAKDPAQLLSKLHRQGIKAGISINPETPVEKVYPLLDIIDYVLIMSVHPGKAGQAFLPAALEKIVALKEKKPTLIVEIDGGIGLETIGPALQAGADIFVIGSAIYKSADPLQAIRSLRKELKR